MIILLKLYLLFPLIILGVSLFHKNILNRKVLLVFALFQNVISFKLLNISYINSIKDVSFSFPVFSELGVFYSVSFNTLNSWFIILNSLFLLFIFLNYKESLDVKKSSLVIFLSFCFSNAILLDNLLLFYFFWELMLFPLFFLIGFFGGFKKQLISPFFVLYTAVGSLFMLVAIIIYGIYSYKIHGYYDFEFNRNITNGNFNQLIPCSLLLISFLIKIPIFPFHTWLPKVLKTVDRVTLSCFCSLIFSAGIYGILKYCVFLFPLGLSVLSPYLALLCTVSFIFGATKSLYVKSIRDFLAYSSVSHLSLIVFGLSTLSINMIPLIIYYTFVHGILMMIFIKLLNKVEDNAPNFEIGSRLGFGKRRVAFSAIFLLCILNYIGLPLTASFFGEFFILFTAFKIYPYLSSVCFIAVFLVIVYTFKLKTSVLSGECSNKEMPDLSTIEIVRLLPILIILIFLGFYPNSILDTTKSAFSVYEIQMENK